jgi:pyruvate/2-oxoglutarate/acetoin dehydrogenase E1 component
LAERSIVEAINDCLHVELARDSSVMVMGEDVGRAGGVFRATAGLRDRFGADRCFDTPLAEQASSVPRSGSAWPGGVPSAMPYDAFSTRLDQLITHVGLPGVPAGNGVPIVVRCLQRWRSRAELHDAPRDVLRARRA